MGLSTVGFKDINYITEQIMAGNVYSLSFRDELKPEEEFYLQLVTPADRIINLLDYDLKTYAEMEDITIEIIKDPTLDSGVTEVDIHNMNDRFTKSSEVVVYEDPSNISGGIVKYSNTINTLDNNSKSIMRCDFVQRILQADTIYAIKIENEGVNDTNIVFNLLFSESDLQKKS